MLRGRFSTPKIRRGEPMHQRPKPTKMKKIHGAWVHKKPMQEAGVTNLPPSEGAWASVACASCWGLSASNYLSFFKAPAPPSCSKSTTSAGCDVVNSPGWRRSLNEKKLGKGKEQQEKQQFYAKCPYDLVFYMQSVLTM